MYKYMFYMVKSNRLYQASSINRYFQVEDDLFVEFINRKKNVFLLENKVEVHVEKNNWL